MKLTPFQKSLYNFTQLGQKNINIKYEKYKFIEIKWLDICSDNIENGYEFHWRLIEEYINKL